MNVVQKNMIRPLSLLLFLATHCEAQLSTGQTVGIAVGVPMAVLLLIVAIYLLCKKFDKGKRRESITETSILERDNVTITAKTVEQSTQTFRSETKDRASGTVKADRPSVSVQTMTLKSDDKETQTAHDCPAVERQKSRESITFTSGWRRSVKLTELIRARLISETIVRELEGDKVTEAEVEKEMEPFLIGRYPIAGVLVTETSEKMSMNEAYRKGIITRGTAVSLLEAQAAVGSIIEPRDGSKMSVEKAKEVGLIDRKMAGIIVRAEKAVTGFKSRATHETLSLFQAMKRNLVVESHGIRLLEAQIATGGIIDPIAHIRLPVEVAFERGLFDEHLHQILEDPTDDTKGFLDPNTGENLTYLELLQRCVLDEDTGLMLLPLLPEDERQGYKDKHASISYPSSPTFSTSSETPSTDDLH